MAMTNPMSLLATLLLTFTVFFWTLPVALADVNRGSCAAYDFTPYLTGPEGVDLGRRVLVRENGVSVSTDAEHETLSFNDTVEIIGISDILSPKFVKVQTASGFTGWADAAAFQCQDSPLLANCSNQSPGSDTKETEIEVCEVGATRKVFIIAPSAIRGKDELVPAFFGSDLPDCGSNRLLCRPASRFDVLFVVGETRERLLLSEHFYPRPPRGLTGWVDKNKTIPWNSALGLRPAETLPRLNGDEGAICAFHTLEAALNREGCQLILGGNRWHQSAWRMPVLARYNKNSRSFLKVVMPAKICADVMLVSLCDKYLGINFSWLSNSAEFCNPMKKSLGGSFILFIENTNGTVHGDHTAVDVMLSDEDFEIWYRILKPLSRPIPAILGKIGLVNSLSISLSKALGVSLGNTDVPIGEFIRQFFGLPVRSRSPLMSYSLDDFIRPGMQRCEVRKLHRWINATFKRFQIVEKGTRRVVGPEVSAPINQTCDLTEKGRNIPDILPDDIKDGGYLGQDAEDTDSYSYRKRFGGIDIYWMPLEYMP